MNQPNNNFGTMPYNNMNMFVPPVPQITGAAGGTSIAALKQNQPQNNSPRQNIPNQPYGGQMQNGMQGMSDLQIAQIMGANKSMPNPEINEQENEAASQNIRHLVKDLNRSLDGYGPSKKSMSLTEESDTEDEPLVKKKSSSFGSYIPMILKEPMLLLVIYIVMSQSFVKKAISTYIPQLENNLDGNKTFLGIVMYGTILALLFVLFKKILL